MQEKFLKIFPKVFLVVNQHLFFKILIPVQSSLKVHDADKLNPSLSKKMIIITLPALLAHFAFFGDGREVDIGRFVVSF